MYRSALEELKAWKEKPGRLPLVLLGARQVGKTWLLKEFGRACYDDVCYVNFEETDSLKGIFDGEISPERIIGYLLNLPLYSLFNLKNILGTVQQA